MRNSKVNCKLSKTDILDTVFSLEVTLEWKTLSGFLKDLISTFVLMLLNFLRKLVLYFHDIYRQSGQNQANTRSSVSKLKHPLKNMYSGQKNLSYLTPIVWNSLLMDLKLANSLNNFKHKLKGHFCKKLRNMEQNIFASWCQNIIAYWTWTAIFSINLKLFFLLFVML